MLISAKPLPNSETGMLKAFPSAPAGSLPCRAQSAGMLKPNFFLQLIRCSAAQESVAIFCGPQMLEHLGYFALLAGQSASLTFRSEQRFSERIPKIPDKYVPTLRQGYLPAEGSALVAVFTSTCKWLAGSIPGG